MTVVADCNGDPLEVGSRVHCSPRYPIAPKDIGIVVRITEPDGDVDEGRVVAINPQVTVRFPDCEDTFPCSTTATDPWDVAAPPRARVDVERMTP